MTRRGAIASVAAGAPTTMGVGVSMGTDTPVFDASDSGLSQYEVMAADGFWGVRIDSTYGSGGGGQYEATIQTALNAGLNVLVILDIYDSSPTNAEFVAFCQEQVTYWSPKGVHHYEILNEPNGGATVYPGSSLCNPAAYATLLQEVYAAIKTIDPTALVSSGGLSTFSTADGSSEGGGNYSGSLLPNSFIYLMYQAMGGSSVGYCDAIGVHPYCDPSPPSIGNGSNWGYFFNPSGTHPYAESSVGAGWNSILAIMGDNGESTKPIWITEVGYNTSDVTEAEQATYTLSMLDMASSYPNVNYYFCFNWNDDGDGDWGLVGAAPTYTPKPSYTAVVDFIAGTPSGPVPNAPLVIDGNNVPQTLVFQQEFATDDAVNFEYWNVVNEVTDNAALMLASNVSFADDGIHLHWVTPTSGPNAGVATGAFLTTGSQFNSGPPYNITGPGFTIAPAPGKPVYFEWDATFLTSGGQVVNWPAAWVGGLYPAGEQDVAEGLGGTLATTIHYDSYDEQDRLGDLPGVSSGTFGLLWTTTGQYVVHNGVVQYSGAIPWTAMASEPQCILIEHGGGPGGDGGPSLEGDAVFAYVRVWQDA